MDVADKQVLPSYFLQCDVVQIVIAANCLALFVSGTLRARARPNSTGAAESRVMKM